MKAIILAAGRGSRLGSITAAQPKPLTVLAGKPLLEWQLEALHHTGVSEVHLVSGYCHDALEPYGHGRLYNPHWASSNMVRSLMRADALLAAEPMLVCYGDIVYRPDIIQSLINSPASLAITYDLDWWSLWSARFNDPLSDAERFRQSDGQLLAIGGHTDDHQQIEGQYMGLLKFTPESWQHVRELLAGLSAEQIDKLDMTNLLSRLLASGTPIAAVAIRGGWVEVDNPSDITLYERLIAQPGWSHDWRQSGADK
ncbi:phosphocholine cytidylyltransferase family protein [Pseudomonas asplenii]|uniref:phosphocholine cytidylyltransferase family protein n=1 Tax=Pseudomonas asplenii TaxID=53407 RepID=UPI00037805CB|nr:phosphocholine cytidylyltransferase family protein [Pseudomonas fuscovaginae]